MGTEFSAPSPAPPPYPPYGPTPSRPPHRLTRSSRERMWAGVAGGMAEYFDLDPALVRLLWVAAAVVSGGLAVPIYILAWIILPRDDRPSAPASQYDAGARYDAGAHAASTEANPTPTAPTGEWWQSDRYFDRPRNHHRHPRSTGVVLVALGLLLLAANAGVFSWIEWRTMWPLIFIGLGVILLARQSGWNR